MIRLKIFRNISFKVFCLTNFTNKKFCALASLTLTKLEVGQNDSPLFNNASSAMVMLRLDKFIVLLNVVR